MLKRNFLKTCCLFVLFQLMNTGLVFTKEYNVKTGLKAYVWNEILKKFINQSMHLNYTESRELFWYLNYTMFPIGISLKHNVRVALLESIQKYKEWNKKASQNNIEISKDIVELPSTTIWFKYGNEWQRDKSCNNDYQLFFSDDSKTSDHHQVRTTTRQLQSISYSCA